MIILVFVYWFLLKIIREYGWNVSVKEIGLVRILYLDSIFVALQIFSIRVWLYTFITFFTLLCKFISIFILKYHKYQDKNITNELFFLKILRFFIGIEVFSGVKNPNWILFWNFQEIEKLVLDRYIFMFLNNYSCNISYFYELPFKFLSIHKFKHSFFSELIWAILPTIIVVLILAPSLYLLYSIDEELDPMLTIKVIGHQWYWTYELSDWIFKSDNLDNLDNNIINRIPSHRNISVEYDSILINDDLLNEGSKRLLEVSKSLAVPINIPIRFLITSTDVLHSWSIPELGLKIDAVPGRLNQFLSVICRIGRLYGQCSELCGVSHAFMPIVMDGVKFNTFTNITNNLIQNINFKSNLPITLSLVDNNIPLDSGKIEKENDNNNIIDNIPDQIKHVNSKGLSISWAKLHKCILSSSNKTIDWDCILPNSNKKINWDLNSDLNLNPKFKFDSIEYNLNLNLNSKLNFYMIDMDRESVQSPFDRTRMEEYLRLNNDRTYFRSVFDGLIFNINELELEKQYHIVLFLRDLLDNPKNQNGNPLSEAELFEYINKMICNEGGYYQSDFFRRLWVECVIIGTKSTPKFSAWDFFIFLDQKICKNEGWK